MHSMPPNGLGLPGRPRDFTDPVWSRPDRDSVSFQSATDKARKLNAPNNATHTRNRSTCINVLPISGEQSCIKRAKPDAAASRRLARLSGLRISQP
jgi:hypothetical protein